MMPILSVSGEVNSPAASPLAYGSLRASLAPSVRAAVFAILMLGGCYRVTEQPNLAGQDVHLTVLHTSDIHARLLPYFQVPGLIDRGYGLCAELQPFGGAAR